MYVPVLSSLAPIGHFRILQKQKESRLRGQVCNLLCTNKEKCKFVLSTSTLFFCSYTIRQWPIEDFDSTSPSDIRLVQSLLHQLDVINSTSDVYGGNIKKSCVWYTSVCYDVLIACRAGVFVAANACKIIIFRSQVRHFESRAGLTGVALPILQM